MVSNTSEKTPVGELNQFRWKTPPHRSQQPLVFVRQSTGGRQPAIFMITPSGGLFPELEALDVCDESVGVRFAEAKYIIHQSIEEAVAQARKVIEDHGQAYIDTEHGIVDVAGATPELLEAMALVMRHGGQQ